MDTQTKSIMVSLNNNLPLNDSSAEKLFEIYEAYNEFEFDIDTVYAISDLAEKLEVPLWSLMDSCSDLVIDIHSDPNYLPPDIEKAIDCGICSDDELKKICDYYDCKYYDLDIFMVENYKKNANNK